MGIIINDGSSPFSPGAGKKLTFSIFASTSHFRQITTVNDIVDGAEHHVAAVSDPITGTLKLYVDGVLQAVNTGSVGAGFPTIGNTMPYQIGSGNTNVWLYKGEVDEVRIWNTARTQAEIQANMNIEPNTSTGLVASYHFNEGIADGNNAGITTATDASGNGNDGTLNNFALNGSTSNWVAGNAFSAPTVSNDAPATYPIGNTIVTWTATDASNNSASATQVVTVVDNEAPVVTCPADITGVIATSAAGAIVNYTAPTGSDNCPGVTTVLLSGLIDGATFPIGTTSVWYQATDAAGNKDSCSFNVTVVGVAPQISCPANIVENNTPGSCDAVVNYTATETAGIPASVITYSIASGSVFNVGTVTVTATATNAVGFSSCTFDVTVNDDEMPATPTLADVTGECSATATASTTTDNCAGAITGTTTDPLTYSTQGTHVIQWTFDDGNGNISMASQNVIVNDVTPPTTPVLADVMGECSATAGNASTTDNCAGTVVGTTNDPLSYSTQGTHVIQWTFDDGNGNIRMASQNVIVNDVTLPTVVTKNISVTLSGGTASIAAADVEDGSSDNCGVDFPLSTVSPNTFGCNTLGANTVTLTLTDVNGNSNTATATVNVIAEISSCSIASTPNSSVYTGGNPNILFLGYGAQSTTLNVTAIGGSVWTYSWSGNTSLLSSATSGNPVFTPTSIGTYTYIVTSTNEFGCSTTCSITIDVIDVNCSNNANNHKVIICHNGKTICVSVNAAASHLSTYSADYVGPCVSSNKTSLTGGGNLNVMAYPSPYNSSFNIDIITSSENPVDITLYGMDGKILEFYTNLNPADAPPMGAGLSNGMYILSVTQNGIIKRIKVTKE